MKNIFLALSLLLVFASCKKDDNNSTSSAAALAVAVNSTIATGNWRITYFFDSVDETANFAGYAFTFAANNVVTATKPGSTVTGTWSTGSDDSRAKLVLTFASPTDFIDLNEDWHVLERTDTKIRMQHISGGNGGTDYLTFERN